MNKLRIGGKTIDPKKQYNGREVIELLNVSYANGFNKARREIEKETRLLAKPYDDGYNNGYKCGYNEGYGHGYNCASEDLKQLKILLNRMLKN